MQEVLTADDNAIRYIAGIRHYYEYYTEAVMLCALPPKYIFTLQLNIVVPTNYRNTFGFFCAPVFAQNPDGRTMSRRMIQSINPLPQLMPVP